VGPCQNQTAIAMADFGIGNHYDAKYKIAHKTFLGLARQCKGKINFHFFLCFNNVFKK
jgi:hypothetical protein